MHSSHIFLHHLTRWLKLFIELFRFSAAGERVGGNGSQVRICASSPNVFLKLIHSCMIAITPSDRPRQVLQIPRKQHLLYVQRLRRNGTLKMKSHATLVERPAQRLNRAFLAMKSRKSWLSGSFTYWLLQTLLPLDAPFKHSASSVTARQADSSTIAKMSPLYFTHIISCCFFIDIKIIYVGVSPIHMPTTHKELNFIKDLLLLCASRPPQLNVAERESVRCMLPSAMRRRPVHQYRDCLNMLSRLKLWSSVS